MTCHSVALAKDGKIYLSALGGNGPVAKKEGKQQIKDLVRKFERMPDYRLKTCNEEQTKKNFILPLFEALGWDVRSDEVRAEETVSGGRVDYAFKIGDITKFYLEAKPAKADLEKDKYEEQLIDYAYNKDVTWGVLTNFKELRIFNALEKTPRPITFTFEDYLKDFDLLWLISKESFETGEINKWAQRLGIESIPVPPVGERLAKDLTEWRDELTDYISKWEEKLSQEEVDEAVQKFLDRLIFIRVAEDRGLEEKVLLPLYHNKDKVDLIAELNKLFREFDKKYDSTLFHEHFSEDLELEGIKDNIANIIKRTHITKDEKRYDFSLIDADILGAVYEQYLGTIQRKGKGAKRKEQGIYYTPKFIVNYIVENTLGKLLREEMTPVSEVKKLKILDPACGSGSFLIKAFEVLDEFYGKAKAPESERRKHILTKNLYGVDLDPKAIEVAQLNLMLSAAKKRELLPELHENLKVGNSLVSGGRKELEPYFGDRWEKQRPFNWTEEFKEVFGKGGFDVIIGNPPWVSLKGKHKSLSFTDQELKYFIEKLNANTYAPNLYEMFIWRSLSLLKEGGLFSFIVPDRFFANEQFEKLREYILKNFTIKKLLFRAGFPGVIADTAIFVFQNRKPEEDRIEVTEYPSREFEEVPQSLYLNQEGFPFFYIKKEIFEIFERILSLPQVTPLGRLVESTSGCGAKSSLLCEKRTGKKEMRVMKGENIGRYQHRGCFWFEFKDENLTGRTRDANKLGMREKILLRKTGLDLVATFDDSGAYPEQSLYFLYGLDKETFLYLLAIINSKLMNVYYKNFAITNRYSTPQLKNVHLEKFPIAEDAKRKKSKLSRLAEQILDLNKQLQVAAEGGNKWRRLKSEIEKTDTQIDRLVYKLYNLTPEEIKIVEESLR